MKELKAQNLYLTYGEKVLLDTVSLSIREGEKIGLIGINGSGKTHLMNILAFEMKPEKGDIIKPGDFSVGYLKQDPLLNPENTVLQAVFAGENPIMNAVRDYEEALHMLMAYPERDTAQNAFSKAEEKMNSQNAWTADAQAKSILSNLGISNLQSKVKDLSGGQAKRVGIAQVLIQEPDLLLLDEPTNHLDFETIQWLERTLAKYRGALVMVTHDRYFLERVVSKIVELSNGKLHTYEGNYETYVTQKAEREETAEKQEHKQKQLYKQELAWMRKGPRARGTKQEARKQRFEDLSETIAGQASDDLSLEVQLTSSHIGKQVLELKEATLTIEDHKILDHFNMLIQNRDRIGVTGQNGAGKTTFLDILSGVKELDSGERIIGETIRIAYYTQTSKGLDEGKRVIQFLQEIAEEVQTVDGHRMSVSQLLETFLFPKSAHGTIIGRLSGGEKRRLYLLSLLMQQPNVLLLDEPTNDLDLATLTVLEEYIDSFPGAVISVSHDRYFLDKTSDKLMVFEGQAKIDEFYGTLTEYHLKKEEAATPKVVSKMSNTKNEKSISKSKTSEKNKLTFSEQKEWDKIEDDLFHLEEKMAVLDKEMIDSSTDYEKIQILEQERSTIQKEFDLKMNRWEYLSKYVTD